MILSLQETGHVSGAFNVKNKNATNIIASARFTFERGVKKEFVLSDQDNKDGVLVSYKVLTPAKMAAKDGSTAVADVDVQSTMTCLIFVNDRTL